MTDALRFHRVLRRRDVVALAFGAMIGWSWVLLSGEWTTRAGTLGAVAAFVGGGVAVVLIALTYAELAAMMPEAGGEHVYSLRALGPRWSFVCSWAMLFGYLSVAAFEAVALPYAVTQLLPGTDRVYLWTVAGFDVHLSFVAMGVVAALVLTCVNIVGVRPAAVLQFAVTVVILLCGVLLVTGAGMSGVRANLDPWFSAGGGGVLAVLVMVPIMFVGFDVIPQAAEEIALPPAAIGTLVVFSVVMAVAFYAAVIIAVGLALTPVERGAGGMTTALAAGALWDHRWAYTALVLGGIAGILSTWNAFLLGSSRLVYAMAESGMLPRVLARVHPTFGTPHFALVAIGLATCAAPWFGRPVLIWLINAGSFGVIVAYALVTLSFLVLRRREPNAERPFRVPAGALVGTGALALSVAISLLYLPGSPAALSWPAEWLLCLGWIALGLVLANAARRQAAVTT